MSHIGTRQGCPWSLYLFNLFINYIPSALNTYKGNPVQLYSYTLNVSMYADDIVILSESPKGLQNSLIAPESYYNKWKLSVNLNKT